MSRAGVRPAPAPLPDLGPPSRVRPLRVSDRTLASGLRVLAVRRSGTPLVELRLRVPFASMSKTYPARSSLLSAALLTGTGARSRVALAEDLQRLGADLSVGSDADRLMISGTTLATGLGGLLDILGDVLTGAAYPAREVTAERGRLVERLSLARSQPGLVVREVLDRRIFGGHPYAAETPTAEAVNGVAAPAVRRLHHDRVAPTGSVLVLVGDISPARALDAVEAALSSWRTGADAVLLPACPPIEPGPALLVDRAGSVQSSIRLAGTALPRTDPGYPALQLANLVYGGYFSSRLTENIREDKGYSYTPISRIDHGVAGSTLVTQADVATEVTAPALVEIGYELGRMATRPVGAHELDTARQYAIGTLALSIATQAGLASMLAALTPDGLDAEWLRSHPARLATVTVDEVAEQAARHLAPGRMATVVLGDVAAIRDALAVLGPVIEEAPAR